MASNDRTLRISRSVVLAKEEVDEGLDPVPTGAANAIEVVEASITPAGETRDRTPLSVSMSPRAPVTGTLWWDVSLTVEAKSNGSANSGLIGDIPEFDVLMRSSACKRQLSVGNWIDYLPESDPTNQITCTVYVYYDGVRHILRACRFNVEQVAESGDFSTFVFTGQGLWTKPTDVALPATPNLLTTSPPVLESACVELGSPSGSAFNPIIQNFSVNLNNEVAPRLDPCSSYAVKGFVVGDRNPQGGYDPEATLIADHDFWLDYAAKTQRKLSVQVGKTAGQIVETIVAKSVIREIPYGTRETWRTHDINYQAVGFDSGDNEVRWRFR